jgi:uncharacterized membrane protein
LPEPGQTIRTEAAPRSTARIALVAIFAALIAVATIVSIPMPPPLYEITWAPAIYLALSYLVDRKSAFTAIAIGSFVGETFNILTKPGGSPIYPFGIVWARAPEALIVAWSKGRGMKYVILSMFLATIYETVAFIIPDGFFYSYGLFSYGPAVGFQQGFEVAFASDIFTLVDLAYIPVALGVIKGSQSTFRRMGFS